ncbi:MULTISPECIES: peptidase inhibitor family I36 protein [Streptomyces]|uniref:peptidase inhibitor family I36 protein n=1 Tax=Streptomyces TaxID=1883 RepID=UPI00141EE604|nr:peptidase inhibitor family I36 protein [Streptomyces sp. MBT27]
MRTTTTTLALLAATAFLLPAAVPATAAPRIGDCAPGELCLWAKAAFKGPRQVYDLTRIDIESCTALPPGTDVQSLANRTGRPVTAYQSDECQETAEFDTYPGGGTWVPQVPYRVRAFKVWES